MGSDATLFADFLIGLYKIDWFVCANLSGSSAPPLFLGSTKNNLLIVIPGRRRGQYLSYYFIMFMEVEIGSRYLVSECH